MLDCVNIACLGAALLLLGLQWRRRELRQVGGLCKGMCVTQIEPASFGSGMIDRSYMGDVLKILHVEYPFVIVEQLHNGLNLVEGRKPFSVDSLVYKLAPVSKQFCKSLQCRVG